MWLITGHLEVLTTFLCPSGVVNMSFPLSDQPVFGEWFIFVEVQGHTYNKSFEVQKYGEAQHSQESNARHVIALFIRRHFFKRSFSPSRLLNLPFLLCGSRLHQLRMYEFLLLYLWYKLMLRSVQLSI